MCGIYCNLSTKPETCSQPGSNADKQKSPILGFGKPKIGLLAVSLPISVFALFVAFHLSTYCTKYQSEFLRQKRHPLSEKVEKGGDSPLSKLEKRPSKLRVDPETLLLSPALSFDQRQIFEGQKRHFLSLQRQKSGRYPKRPLDLEVTTRFELVNEGFADPCLTTWPRHHIE